MLWPVLTFVALAGLLLLAVPTCVWLTLLHRPWWRLRGVKIAAVVFFGTGAFAHLLWLLSIELRWAHWRTVIASGVVSVFLLTQDVRRTLLVTIASEPAQR